MINYVNDHERPYEVIMKKAGMKLRTDLRETATVKKIAERIKRTVKSQPTGGAGLSVDIFAAFASCQRCRFRTSIDQ